MITLNWNDEPFESLTLLDIAIFGGGLAASMLITVSWLVLAARRGVWIVDRFLVACWLSVNLLVAVESIVAYLREPWSQ